MVQRGGRIVAYYAVGILRQCELTLKGGKSESSPTFLLALVALIVLIGLQ
jgi:hypothetical protein